MPIACRGIEIVLRKLCEDVSQASTPRYLLHILYELRVGRPNEFVARCGIVPVLDIGRKRVDQEQTILHISMASHSFDD